MGGRRCSCHGEPLERNPGSAGGWRCVVKRRAAQRAYYERVRKHDPADQLDRKLRDMTRVRISY